MRHNASAIVLILTTAVALRAPAAAQQAGISNSSKSAKSSKNPVHEIVLPDYPIELPPAPNLAAYQQHCLLCHSSRYVAMQPRFSRALWEKEVKKMVDAYGAPISAQEQQQIVNYLVAIKGPTDAK